MTPLESLLRKSMPLVLLCAAGLAASGGASSAGAAGAGGTPASTEYPGIPDVVPVNVPAQSLYMPIWAPLYELSGNTIAAGSPNV
jgi:hypothetical protein